MEKRVYPLRTKLLALGATVAILLVLLEIVLQVVGYDPRWVADFGELAESRAYIRHPRYLWTLRPNTFIQAGDIGLLDIRVTSRGLRGPAPSSHPKPDELRVLCLGDSITFGLGLPNGETWPERMERALEARTGRPVSVLNGGLPGWTSVQGMRLYRDLVREGRYDFVVFWFGMNDAKEANDGIPDAWYRWQPTAEERGPLSWSRVAGLLWFAVRAVRRAAGASLRRVSVAEFSGAVDEIRAAARRGGPRPIFVRSPNRLDETIHEFASMEAQATRLGLDRLSGPAALFNPYGPALNGAEPIGRKVDTNLGPSLHFDLPGKRIVHADLETVRSILAWLRGWKGNVDRYLALLPEESLTWKELLGERPGPELLRDNCHLRIPGADRVGEAIAREIGRRLGE